MAKRHKRCLNGRLKRSRNSETLHLATKHSSAFKKTPATDLEFPSTKKFSSALISQIPLMVAQTFTMRKEQWRSITSNQAIPTFMDMSNEERTKIVSIIQSYGCAPSAVLYRVLGLTACQVGAIRRWHLPKWRDLTNQDIYRAFNLNRVVIKRK